MTLFDLVQSAENGVPEAQYVLGILYQNGFGCEPDMDKAKMWYSRAAEQGSAAAEYSLGTLLGNNSSFGDHNEALAYYKTAIKTGQWSGEPAKAFKLSLKAAKKGFWPAQDAVSAALELGYGTKANPKKAFQWAKKSADSGYIRAATHLANMFQEGRGTPADLKQALHYYKRAAELGDGLAAFMAASIYKEKKPIAWYHKDILKWLHKSADLNYINAHFELYWVYAKGLYGRPINQKTADQHQKRAEELTEAMTDKNASPIDKISRQFFCLPR